MKEIKLDDTIKSFCGSDELREKLLSPKADGEFVFASDGHVMIVAPNVYFNENYAIATKDNSVDYKSAIPNHIKDETIAEIDVDAMVHIVVRLPRENMYVECEVCEGDGNLYTINHNAIECEECGGNGRAYYIGNLIPTVQCEGESNELFIFKLAHNGEPTFFNPNLFEKILTVANKIKKPLRCVMLNSTRASIFYCDDIMMLIMPMKSEGEDWEEHVKQITIKTKQP